MTQRGLPRPVADQATHQNLRYLLSEVEAVASSASDVLSLINFRETRRTPTEVDFEWELGERVGKVWIYDRLLAQGADTEPWPASLTESSSQIEADAEQLYTALVPPPGYVRYLQFEPRDPNLTSGPIKRVVMLPLSDEPDGIGAVVVEGNRDDGSVHVRVDASPLAGSFRYAYQVGADPGWPSNALVEAGTVRTIESSDEFTLPAGTVPLGQMIRLRVAGYVNDDGTGHDGVTDHGEPKGGEWIREKYRKPSLEITSETQACGTGTMQVRVKDPDGLATALHFRRKAGPGDWGEWELGSASPGDGQTYNAPAVAVLEKHESAIRARLTGTLGGQTVFDYVTSVFNAGVLPQVLFLNVDHDPNGNVTATVNCDSDTGGFYVHASVAGYADRATTKASGTLVPARSGSVVGLVALNVGQTAYVTVLAVGNADGSGPEASELAFGQATFGIDSEGFVNGSLLASHMRRQAKGWLTDDIRFDVKEGAEDDAITWTGGDIRTADEQVTIEEGELTGMDPGVLYYVYWDGSTTFKSTDDFTVALHEDHIVLAVARAAPSELEDAYLVPAVGALGGGIHLNSDQITTNYIQALSAHIISLTALSADLGDIIAGRIRNDQGTSGTRGIQVSGEIPTSWEVFLNLSDPTKPAFKHYGLELGWGPGDGAVFSGEVSAESFTAATAVFSGSLEIKTGGADVTLILDETDIRGINGNGVTRWRINHAGLNSDGVFQAPNGEAWLQSLAGDVRLVPGGSGVVHFDYALTATSKTALNEWLPIEVDGVTKHLRLYN